MGNTALQNPKGDRVRAIQHARTDMGDADEHADVLAQEDPIKDSLLSTVEW